MHDHERRSLLLPKKWKALFGFLGFSGLATVVMLLVGGGKAWEKWDAIQEQAALYQRQQLILTRQIGDLRGRVAELTVGLNETRRYMQPPLPPIVHQSILDGEPVAYILPRKPTRHSGEVTRPAIRNARNRNRSRLAPFAGR